MAEHNDLARGHLKALNAKKTSTNLWVSLTTLLNENGPPVRSVVEWKKVWADYKYKVKTKLRFNKNSKRQTGGGPCQEKSLDVFEESVVKSAGLEAAVEGIRSAKSYGCIFGNAEASPVAAEPVEITEEYLNGNLSEIYEHEIEAGSDDTPIVPKKTAKGNKFDYMQQYIEKLAEANKIQTEILEQKKKENALKHELLELTKKNYYLQKENIKDKRVHRKESLRLKKMHIEAKIEANRLKALDLDET